MSVYSKCFDTLLSDYSLKYNKSIVTENYDGLLDSIIQKSPGAILKGLKFYFPIYFIPLLFNAKNISRKKLIQTLHLYFDSIRVSFLTTLSIYLTTSTVYYFNGKFTYRSLIQIPATLGTFLVMLCSNNHKVNLIYSHTTSLMALEIFIRNKLFWPLKYIRNSPIFRTLAFMSASAFILDAIQNAKIDKAHYLPWLLKPLKRKECAGDQPCLKSTFFDLVLPIDRNYCFHSTSCDRYLFEGFLTYFLIGVGMDVMKNVFMTSTPHKFFLNPLTSFNWRAIFFTAGYPVFYRLFNCSLNRYFKQNSRLNNLCAAFFGGFPFYYHPQLQWLTHAACCSIELLWSQILLSNFGMASSLDKIPFARILFALGIGYSAHIKVFRPWLTPKFAHRSLTILTNNFIDEVGTSLHALWLG